jgi:hypothetical protein
VPDDRLPTYLLIDATLRELYAKGAGVYVVNRGDKTGGMLLIKISDTKGLCKLVTQQRDLDGVLTWVNVFDEETPDEKKADDYIGRAVNRDPDLWVIEVEDPLLANPFNV